MPASPLSKLIRKGWAYLEDLWHTGMDENLDLINAFIHDQWANQPLATTGLTYAYRGGVGVSGGTFVQVADNAVVLTNNATNYIERTVAGVVSANTTGWTRGRYPMARVVTAGGVITSIQDWRPMPVTSPFVTVPYVLDGGGQTLTTGLHGGLLCDVPGTIIGASLLAADGLAGSIVVDIWKTSWAGAPPTVANTITAAAKPTIVAGTKYQDLTLTGWSTGIAQGDVLFFNIDSVATFQRVMVGLTVFRA